MLRRLFPEKEILKQHQIQSSQLQYAIVSTIRHPLDCVSSMILASKLNPTDEVVDQHAEKFLTYGMESLITLKEYPLFLYMKYEDFVGNFTFLFDKLESFFEISINSHQREELEAKYCITAVRKVARKLESFETYDPITQIHGNHISQYNGASGYYQEFLTPKQIAKLKKRLAPFFEAFGYE